MALFRSFKINKLFGYKNVKLEFDSDYMILIGENGSGKTTILNCIYFVLSKQFEELSKINFESIEIVWGKNGKKWKIDKIALEAKRIGNLNLKEKQLLIQIHEVITVRDVNKILTLSLSPADYEQKVTECYNYLLEKGLNTRSTKYMVYNVATLIVNDVVAYMFEEKVQEMEKYINGSISFLPTYRRIERNIADTDKTDSILGIRYGMSDVNDLIDEIKKEIDKYNKDGFAEMTVNLLSRFTGIIDRNRSYHLQNDKIELVLNRLGDKLTEEHKNSIINYLKESKHNNEFIEAIVDELYKIYTKQEHLDKAIKMFVSRCNLYLQNKKFIYDESNVEIRLISQESNKYVDLELLSSGEKQIISMMAYLYLNTSGEKFIFLIDEPELSLSIKWQELLLPDLVESGKCSFLLAVTHSPFIFNNQMKQYAVGIHKYVTNEEL